MLPAPLFPDTDPKRIFTINFPEWKGYSLLNNYIQEFDLHVLAGIPDCVYHVFRESFPHIRFLHHSVVLLKTSVRVSPAKEGNILFASYSQQLLTVIVSRRKELILCNVFQYSTMDDIIYFLINTADQISGTDTPPLVMIAGDPMEFPLLEERMKRYLPEVVLWRHGQDYSNALSIPPVLTNSAGILINAPLCVS
jgi:hypothetical protein